jgi:hypothetical protein
MTYVKCINNRTLSADEPESTYDPELVIGRVYKLAQPEANDGDRLRVIDGSGEDYLYPADYFEPFARNGDDHADAITVHLDAYIKGVLHAEAVAAQKSVSALVREWVEERLDLAA